MATSISRPTLDQADTQPFKLTLAVQAVASFVFGLAPLLVTGAYADAIGFSGNDPLVYRLGGAATTGYLVAAVAALSLGSGWRELRIPAVATITYTALAALASLWEYAIGARQQVVEFVMVAGTVFTLVGVYWWLRDDAADLDSGRRLDRVAQVVVGLATASAAVFGLFPLLAPDFFAQVFGLAGTDTWVFRMAGAACFGYATAGIASLLAPGYRFFRVQNFAAITFNALAAGSAWFAVVNGGGGRLAPIVAVAASFFTVALVWLDRRLVRVTF